MALNDICCARCARDKFYLFSPLSTTYIMVMCDSCKTRLTEKCRDLYGRPRTLKTDDTIVAAYSIKDAGGSCLVTNGPLNVFYYGGCWHLEPVPTKEVVSTQGPIGNTVLISGEDLLRCSKCGGNDFRGMQLSLDGEIYIEAMCVICETYSGYTLDGEFIPDAAAYRKSLSNWERRVECIINEKEDG